MFAVAMERNINATGYSLIMAIDMRAWDKSGLGGCLIVVRSFDVVLHENAKVFMTPRFTITP